MNRIQKRKITVDIIMTVLLLLVMAYMVTGERAHEWLGMGMFVLFFVHNWLNRQWYRGLWKGKYNGLRVLGTAVNMALVVTMLLMLYSSIILSNYALRFLNIHGSMSLARNVHLAGSYWAFLLMSMHLGLHWGMLMNVFQKLISDQKGETLSGRNGKNGKPSGGNVSGRKLPAQREPSGTCISILRILALAAAAYGAWAFWKNDLLSYMLLQNLFVFFDYEQPAVLFFSEYAAMMVLWACLAYYLSKFIKRGAAARKSEGRPSGVDVPYGGYDH